MTPARFMAVDPGATYGWAAFDCGELVACGVGYPPVIGSRSGAVIVEVPDRVEPGIPLRDVLMCARRAGKIERDAERELLRLETVPPVRWKGTLSKRTTELRVREALTPVEAARLPKVARTIAHNMLDAIGIGLWALGRFGRGGGIFKCP